MFQGEFSVSYCEPESGVLQEWFEEVLYLIADRIRFSGGGSSVHGLRISCRVEIVVSDEQCAVFSVERQAPTNQAVAWEVQAELQGVIYVDGFALLQGFLLVPCNKCIEFIHERAKFFYGSWQGFYEFGVTGVCTVRFSEEPHELCE